MKVAEKVEFSLKINGIMLIKLQQLEELKKKLQTAPLISEQQTKGQKIPDAPVRLLLQKLMWCPNSWLDVDTTVSLWERETGWHGGWDGVRERHRQRERETGRRTLRERQAGQQGGAERERQAEWTKAERAAVNTGRESIPNTARTLLHALIRNFSQSALLFIHFGQQ